MNRYCFFLLFFLLPITLTSQTLVPVGEGWANNSVNATVFRKNSVVTYRNMQFTAYYDADGFLTLGKRRLNSQYWEISRTQYKGNVNDAHNSISIMVDADGYLHVSWDHHGHPLRYARSISPLSLQLGDKEEMTGENEQNVTYPEFFKLPDGNLIFMYRDGSSGRGNLVINKYDCKTKRWSQTQENLISGENKRNAYWQACVDEKGTINVSWVWRESWLVETNHDMCYARSNDGGNTWQNSRGETYALPITATTTEYACRIPQNSELINQTSMTTDDKGNPFIATYWREQDSKIPQYRIVYNDGEKWNVLNTNFRNTPFSLSGGGTKRIPISRPQIVVNKGTIHLIFRDEERQAKVSIATCSDIKKNEWTVEDLTHTSVDQWEPSYDTELWQKKKKLHLFVQKAEQIDGEGKADIAPQAVQILEVNKALIKGILMKNNK